MNYNEKKIICAKMTQNGVIEELKKATANTIIRDEEKYRAWLAELCEIYLDAANDITYHTKQLEAAKAETEVNE